MANDEARPAGDTVRFLGAAGTVTGSKHLVEAAGRRILLDCGLFQGLKSLRERNWRKFPFDPASLDAVVLSHAHIDHSGALPLLVKEGFRGKIHCTAGTAELLEPMLLDAAHLQEEEARFANKHRTSKHAPALPLFGEKDAERALSKLAPHGYAKEFSPADGLRVLYRRASHILGSATVSVAWGRGEDERRLLFSGDLGRYGRPILRDPDPIEERPDVLLVESTYGDRIHPEHPSRELARIVREAADRRGVIVIPAFAVDRTQELLYVLGDLQERGEIPAIPVYVDSPMAIEVTAIYARHSEDHDEDMAPRAGERRLGPRNVKMLRSSAESKSLNEASGPMIVISASGMATGGRVLHHLARRLPDPSTTVLFAGYQAAGTRGRALMEGARTLRIFGQQVTVRAHVEKLDGYSAHADQAEILRWLGTFPGAPRQTWCVHGEPQAADTLASTIRHGLGWEAAVAEDGATVPIS
ncbi:MAG: MBL fold metallo-hydrolase RNA specificity domain-containing protein [Alphaproteobacteria bacterium]